MAVSSEVVAVTSTATALNTAGTSALRLTINPSADIDLGDSTVSNGAGYTLATADAPLTVEVDAGDVLFAVTGTSADVDVLRT